MHSHIDVRLVILWSYPWDQQVTWTGWCVLEVGGGGCWAKILILMTGKRGLGPAQAQLRPRPRYLCQGISPAQAQAGRLMCQLCCRFLLRVCRLCSTGLCCSARCLGQTTCQMIVIPPARSLSCSNINYSAPPCQPSPGAGALKPLSLASLCSLQHCSTKPPLTLTSCVQIFANNSWCPPSLPAILDQVLPASLAAKVHGKPPRATGLVCVSQPCVIQETLPKRGGGTFSIIIFRRGPPIKKFWPSSISTFAMFGKSIPRPTTCKSCQDFPIYENFSGTIDHSWGKRGFYLRCFRVHCSTGPCLQLRCRPRENHKNHKTVFNGWPSCKVQRGQPWLARLQTRVKSKGRRHLALSTLGWS